MPIPVILDCDTGTDDALAIMLAALHPDLDLLGVTTVWGNHEVRHTTDNTLRVLDHLGFTEVPVHAGLPGPYAGRPAPLPGGRADLRPVLDLPVPTRPPGPGTAVDWLVETLRAATEPVALVATGPFSNVAAAVAADPAVVEMVDPLVLLGGTHARPGVTRWAERNVWSDPAAAAAVLAAPARRIVMIGMDATFAVPLTTADVESLAALGTRAGDVAARLAAERIAWYRRDPEMAALGAAPLHDPLAVAFLVEPSVVDRRPAACVVETEDRERLGATRYDLAATDAGIEVALGADRDTYLRVLTSTYARG
jgi:inosine-uridine nucleoside N-ribohydrolase